MLGWQWPALPGFRPGSLRAKQWLYPLPLCQRDDFRHNVVNCHIKKKNILQLSNWIEYNCIYTVNRSLCIPEKHVACSNFTCYVNICRFQWRSNVPPKKKHVPTFILRMTDTEICVYGLIFICYLYLETRCCFIKSLQTFQLYKTMLI